LNRSVAGHPK